MTQVRYRPVVLEGQEQTNTYRALAADSADVKGHDPLEHGGDIASTAKRAAEFLETAFTELVRAHAVGARMRLIVPVNSYALASNAGSTVLVRAVKTLPEILRTSVIVEVYQFPRSLTLDALDGITIPLLPFFSFYIARPPVAVEDFTVFANCNYQGICLDLDACGEDREERLTASWAGAAKARLKLFVHGIASQAEADAARRYQVLGMDGPFLGEDRANLTDTIVPQGAET